MGILFYFIFDLHRPVASKKAIIKGGKKVEKEWERIEELEETHFYSITFMFGYETHGLRNSIQTL